MQTAAERRPTLLLIVVLASLFLLMSANSRTRRAEDQRTFLIRSVVRLFAPVLEAVDWAYVNVSDAWNGYFDMRSAVQPYSLLSVIGQGCHRMSEIAGRMGKPATSLMRPLTQLVDLGYVRREIPFGEDAKSTKRSLYKIDDPFLAFYFRFLQPNKSQLEVRAVSGVMAEVLRQLPLHVSLIWEELARASVPSCPIGGHEWGAARRWWGAGSDGTPLELDVVAESRDGKAVLIGEAKWSAAALSASKARDRLLSLAKNLPFVRGREVVPVLWAKRGQESPDAGIQTPDAVLDALQ